MKYNMYICTCNYSTKHTRTFKEHRYMYVNEAYVAVLLYEILC